MTDTPPGSTRVCVRWPLIPADLACTKIQDGTHFSPKQQLANGPFPYVTAKNVRSTGLDLGDITYLSEPEHRAIYTRCDARKGDVLLVKDGVNTGDTAINTISGQISLLSSVCFLRPADFLQADFLRYWLISPEGQSQLLGRMTGTAIRRLVLHRVKETEVPLAPLPEQARIAEALDSYLTRLDAATEGLKRVEANLKRYRASVLKAAVEGHLVPTESELAKKEKREYEPASVLLERILKERRHYWEQAELAKMKAKSEVPKNDKWKDKYEEPAAPDTSELPELPEGWCWTTVEQLASVGTGATPRRGAAAYWEGGTVPWVTSAVVNESRVTSCEEHVTEAALKETNLTLYPAGTVLVAMYGEGKTRGKATTLEIQATTNQALAALVFDRESAAVRPWLLVYLEHNYEHTRRLSSGGVQPNLNLSLVRSIAVPLPPSSEQERIRGALEEGLSRESQVEHAVDLSQARLSRLRQAILRWAFEGKLADQDPNDEPASVLLERIRGERESSQQVKTPKPERARRKSA